MWTNIHDYVFIGIDGLIVCVLYKIYQRRDEVIQNILKAPSIAVGSELKNVLAQNQDISYAVLRGRVQPYDRTIDSPTGLKGVLQVVRLNEHSVKRQFGHWGESVRTIHETQNSVPFAIRSLTNPNGMAVEVENPYNAVLESFLLPASTNFAPVNSTVASTVMGYFTGHAPRGIETTEELLPVDTVITGIGRVVQDMNGHVKICEPTNGEKYPFILSTLPIENIVKRMETRNFFFKVAAYFFATLGVYIAARRVSQWWKLRKALQLRESILRNRATRNLDTLSAAETCIICLCNPREILLLDCGHVCVCADCSQKLGSKCPICRNHITGTHAAYLS